MSTSTRIKTLNEKAIRSATMFRARLSDLRFTQVTKKQQRNAAITICNDRIGFDVNIHEPNSAKVFSLKVEIPIEDGDQKAVVIKHTCKVDDFLDKKFDKVTNKSFAHLRSYVNDLSRDGVDVGNTDVSMGTSTLGKNTVVYIKAVEVVYDDNRPQTQINHYYIVVVAKSPVTENQKIRHHLATARRLIKESHTSQQSNELVNKLAGYGFAESIDPDHLGYYSKILKSIYGGAKGLRFLYKRINMGYTGNTRTDKVSQNNEVSKSQKIQQFFKNNYQLTFKKELIKKFKDSSKPTKETKVTKVAEFDVGEDTMGLLVTSTTIEKSFRGKKSKIVGHFHVLMLDKIQKADE